MKKLVKSVIAAVAPGVLARRELRLREEYARKHFYPLNAKVRAALFPGRQPEILHGPFRGMKYHKDVVWGPATVKWVGFYESELHEAVQSIVDGRYATILDVGAADGYYAVGFARTCPSARVYSYDIDPGSLALQRDLATLNDVSNLEPRGWCDWAQFNELIQGRTAILCDIEGGEFPLLDPAKCPRLLEADLLVELHSFEGRTPDEVGAELTRRFSATHNVQRIVSRGTTPEQAVAKVPALAALDTETVRACLNEWRPTANWAFLWMTRKA